MKKQLEYSSLFYRNPACRYYQINSLIEGLGGVLLSCHPDSLSLPFFFSLPLGAFCQYPPPLGEECLIPFFLALRFILYSTIVATIANLSHLDFHPQLVSRKWHEGFILLRKNGSEAPRLFQNYGKVPFSAEEPFSWLLLPGKDVFQKRYHQEHLIKSFARNE